jgi:hypothetical protein
MNKNFNKKCRHAVCVPSVKNNSQSFIEYLEDGSALYFWLHCVCVCESSTHLPWTCNRKHSVCGIVYQFETGCAGSKSLLSSVTHDATIHNMSMCYCNKGAGHSHMSDDKVKHMWGLRVLSLQVNMSCNTLVTHAALNSAWGVVYHIYICICDKLLFTRLFIT